MRRAKTQTTDLSKNVEIPAQLLYDLNSSWYLHPGQAEVARAVFADRKRIIFLQCGRKYGKLLTNDTKILTVDGWSTMGELEVGDLVFGEDGLPTPVLEIFENPEPELCRLSFSDGSTIDACVDHQWLTHTKATRKSRKRNRGRMPGRSPIKKPAVVTTAEIASTLMAGKEPNHSIPCCAPLLMREKKLWNDPYVLGVWLGDGSKGGGNVTGVDEEIFNEISARGFTVQKRRSTPQTRLVKGLSALLRKDGVLHEKRIPESYLFGSESQRLDLLCGLMDTDGTISKKGYCSFDNTNKNLADGVYHLLVSLGMKPTRTIRVGKLLGAGKKICYRVMFHPTRPVFRLSRKLARIKPLKKSGHRFITAVTPIPSRPGRCISVGNASHLYLAGEALIPTHNTTVMLYCLVRWALTHPNAQVYWFAPKAKQAREIVWESQRLQTFVPKKYVSKIKNTEMRVQYFNGSFVKLDGSDEYEQYRGIEPDAAGYDELKDFDHRFDTAFRPNLGPKKAPLIVAGTPPRNNITPGEMKFHALAAEAKRRPDGFYKECASWERKDPEWLLELESIKIQFEARAAMGDQDAMNEWRVEYGGQYIQGGPGSIFPMFQEGLHTKPRAQILDELRQRLFDCDFYCIADPGNKECFCVVFYVHDVKRGMLYAVDEIYEQDQSENSIAQIYPRIIEKINSIYPYENGWNYIYDEAELWFKVNMMANYEDPGWRPTRKSLYRQRAAEAKPYLGHIKDGFVRYQFFVANECVNGIKEIKGYSKDENGNIPKKHDHWIDTARYLFAETNFEFSPEVPEEEPRILPSRDYSAVQVSEEEELISLPDLDLLTW